MIDWEKIILLAGLVALPLAVTPLHIQLHPKIPWLLYVTLTDILAVTPLLAFEKTKAWGFYLNTVIVIVGILFHLMFNVQTTIGDNLILVSDFALGYALFAHTPKK